MDDPQYTRERITFLEEENNRTQLALEEILQFDSYFSSISESTSEEDLFRKTSSHLKVFTDFEALIFQKINFDRSFSTIYQVGVYDSEFIQSEIKRQIEKRVYSQALREKTCIASPTSDGSFMVFHCLYSKDKLFGMFIGIHKENILETHYAINQLITVLLRKTGYFLSLLHKYKRLHNEIRSLQSEVQKTNFALDDARF